MNSTLHRTKLALAVLLVAAAPAGAAFAGEGNGASFPGDEVLNLTVSRQSAGLPASPYAKGVVLGSTLPTDSNSQGEPEPINSVPPGALDGTPAMQHRQAMHEYWAEQAQRSNG